MKITVENTSKIVNLDDVPARVWEGTTDTGIPVICYITRIAVREGEEAHHEQFRRELMECKAPSAEVEAIPLRMILQ